MRRPHVIAYISLCLIWGSTWLAVHVLVHDVPPFWAAALRFFLAAVLLLIWVMVRRAEWPRDRRQWNAILVLGFTVITIPYALQFWAQQYVTSSLSAVLFSALPLTVALLTPLMTHHTVPRQAVFAMLMAFGGLLVLLYTDLEFGSRAFWGGIAVLVSMFGSAWSAVYAKVHLRGVDPVISTAFQLLIGAVGLFWVTWALEPHRPANWTKSAVLALLFLASFGSATAFAIYYWLLQRLQPYQVSTINLVIPVVAVLEGSLLGHEPIPLMMIVAMAIVLGSVGVVLRAEAGAKAVELVPSVARAPYSPRTVEPEPSDSLSKTGK
jgi:drug/metabolite transporter (DMT)-like permease